MSHGRGRCAGLCLVLILAGLSGCLGGPASDWAYKMTGIRDLQETYDGTGIRVAIIDTGIDPKHPSLDHLPIIWRDMTSGRTEPYDDVGHGSHVAGILAGEGAAFGGRLQGFNLMGAATRVELIVVKAISLDSDGQATGDPDDVANGIAFSVQNWADVICLSLGKDQPLPLDVGSVTLQVNNAIEQGVLVVASAGNDGAKPGQDDVKAPGSIELVIAVGAVSEDRQVASFSNRGSEERNNQPLLGRPDPNKKPEVVAPGVKIRSAWKDGDYAIADGTSQAAPFVCGALALLLQKCSQLRGQNNSDMVRRVKTVLKETAEPVPGQETPHDNAAGYGLLRADRLLGRFTGTC